ncbi:unnamed protein product [Effrenium voratum]|nr:unnamed protein product [Effrenium voratum]
MGDRSRSRSQPRDVASAAKAGNSEQEIVAVAIKQLPPDIRERLEKLFEEGLLKEGDLDLRAITVFASLNENLQSRVLNHMETERIYVANARSKSGFLIATCDKAKTGCLDARGLGAIDPWRTALVAMATPKQKLIDLKSEQDWLDAKGDSPIKINVDVSVVESELGMSNVTVELPLTETCAAVKAKLVAMGVRSIPANRMKLHTEPVGFLKERFTFAFYNLQNGVTLVLSQRKRAGSRFRRDHTVMPKRPKPPPAEKKPEPQPAPGKAAAALPDLPKLPNLPSMPGMTAPGMATAKMPGMPGMPGMPMSMPGGMPGMGIPGMPSLPNLPGLTVPGAMPGKAQGMPMGGPTGPGMPGGYPKMGMPQMPGMPMGMPGMGMPGMGPGGPGGMPMGCGAAAKGMPMGPGGAASQLPKCFGLFGELDRLAVRKDKFTFAAAIKACERAAQWPFVLCPSEQSKRRDMRSRSLARDEVIYNTSISSAREPWLRRDTVSHNAAISCCERGSEWQHAAELFEDMAGQQVARSTIFSSMISAEKGKQWQLALGTEQMHHFSVGQDVIVWNAAISACEKCSQWQHAHRSSSGTLATSYLGVCIAPAKG